MGQFDGIRVGIRDADLDGTADGKISQIEIFKPDGQILEFIDMNPQIDGMELAVLSTRYIDTNNDIFDYPDTQYKVIVNNNPDSSGYRTIQLFEREQSFLLGESDTANVIIIQGNEGLFSITLAESSYSQSITTPEPNSTREFEELLEYSFLENNPQESFEFWDNIQKTGQFPICPSTSQYSIDYKKLTN